MKKNHIFTVSLILFVCIWLTNCKKENTPSENADALNNLKVGINSSCRLTQNAWGNLFTWDFHYNDKGLADEWKIDFGGGNIQDFKMKYDKFNKLTEAKGYDANNALIYITSFSYSGKRIIKQTWTDVLAGTSSETLFTHNSKGQIIREDDNVNDLHEFQTYDNMDNCTRSDYYIGSDLYFSDNYEFHSPVRDPLLTVSGVDFMFPYSGVGYFNKLWFTRNLSIVYDSDGNPFVINDLGASKKDFSIGKQDFPLAVNYYDQTSQGPIDFTFGYSCNRNNNFANQASPEGNRSTSSNDLIKRQGPMLLMGSAKSIKAQLKEFRQQMKNIKNTSLDN